MGHLLGAVDQAKLDEQRGVVQNEKRQGENEPYAISEEMITQACYPEGHPYSWTVIGSMDDLGAAKLEDVQEWFKHVLRAGQRRARPGRRHRPGRRPRRRSRSTSATSPRARPWRRFEAWVAKRTGTQRAAAPGPRAAAAPLQGVEHPGMGHGRGRPPGHARRRPGRGKNSRLYKRLVYDDQIATGVQRLHGLARDRRACSSIQANAKPGVRAGQGRGGHRRGDWPGCSSEGPTEDRGGARAHADAGRLHPRRRAHRRLRRQVRHPGQGRWSTAASPTPTRRISSACARPRRPSCARRRAAWLSDGAYVLEITPFPEYSATASGADRSKLPQAGTPPDGEPSQGREGHAVERACRSCWPSATRCRW